MTYKKCFLLSVFFASLLIGALMLISKPTVSEKTVVATTQPTTHYLYVLPTRHTTDPRTTVPFGL